MSHLKTRVYRKYKKMDSDERWDVFMARDRVIALPKVIIPVVDMHADNIFEARNFNPDAMPDELHVYYAEGQAITWKRNRINIYQKRAGKWKNITASFVESTAQYTDFHRNYMHDLVENVIGLTRQLAQNNGYTLPRWSLIQPLPDRDFQIDIGWFLFCCPVIRELWRPGTRLDDIRSILPIFRILQSKNFATAIRKSFGHNSKYLIRLLGARIIKPAMEAKWMDYRRKPEGELRQTRAAYDISRQDFEYMVASNAGTKDIEFVYSPHNFNFIHSYFNLGLIVTGILDINRIHTLIESVENLGAVPEGDVREFRDFLLLFSEPKRLKLLKQMTWLRDTVRMFTTYPNQIIMPERWKDGKDLHDQITDQYNVIAQEEQAKRYAEEDKLEFEIPDDIKKVNQSKAYDMTIVLATSGKILREWGVSMRNCIGSYFSRGLTGESYLFGVYKNDKITYNIEITKDGKIKQFVGFANSSDIDANDRAIVMNFFLSSGVLRDSATANGHHPDVEIVL